MERSKISFKVNIGLFFVGIIMTLSGLLMQLYYHIWNHEISSKVLGLCYSSWSSIHKISTIIFSLFLIYHVVLHWKWYKTIFRKKLISKNKEVTGLSITIIFVTITGYVAWIFNTTPIRKIFIEIHDKITIILFVFLLFHITRKFKWFINTYAKLKNK